MERWYYGDMSEYLRGRESFYPLSSDNKEEGWGHFMQYLPLLLKKDLPSRRAIPIIHRLATYGAKSQSIPENLSFDAMAHLIIDSNPALADSKDLPAMLDPIKNYFDTVLRTKPDALYMTHVMHLAPQGMSGTSVPMQFNIFMPFRGHVRQYGTRTIGTGKKEVIHAAHIKPIEDPQGNEEMYIGLTEGLRPLFDEMSDTADELMKKALAGGNVKEQLRAAIFLQAWGATILHPFADGNGRTFAAKLVLDLNRMGFPVKKMPGLPEIHELLGENALAGLGPIFLRRFIERAGLSLLRSDQVLPLMNDLASRERYMASLHDAIQHGLRQGTSRDGPIWDAMESGMNAIKLCLSRDGYIDRTFYEANISSIVETNKNARKTSQ